MSAHKLLATLLVASLACAGTALEEDGSGIDGTVLRGPIQPVCTVGVPCDAPFAALFHVRSGGREVAQFRSDADGRFTIALPAGDYTIVPDASAPLMTPTSQARAVRVEPRTTLQVTLDFDTGIR